MCMWEQEDGFNEEEAVWILAQILVPSIMAWEWSGALKKKVSYFCVLQYLVPASVQSETVRYSKNICFLARPKVSGGYYLDIFLSGDHQSSYLERAAKLADPWDASVRSFSKFSLSSWTLQLHMDTQPSIYSGAQTCSQVILIHKAFLLLWVWSGTLHDAFKCNRFKKQNKPRQ